MSERDENLEHAEAEALISRAVQKLETNYPAPNGKCIWCKEPTEISTSRFCCMECREDYDRYWRARR